MYLTLGKTKFDRVVFVPGCECSLTSACKCLLHSTAMFSLELSINDLAV